MGVYGLTFWLLKTCITIIWASRAKQMHNEQEQYAYLAWNAAKYLFRSLSIISQLFLFTKTDRVSCCSIEMKSKRKNHFLIPFIMISLLAIFINSVIDSYGGYTEDLIPQANLNNIVKVVYNSGSVLHLAFCLHMFLYFFIINSHMSSSVFVKRQTNRIAPVTFNKIDDDGMCDINMDFNKEKYVSHDNAAAQFLRQRPQRSNSL